jgi:hypothetical protein
MKPTIRRVVVTLASVAAIAAAGAGGVRAADPTLGATIEADVFLDEDAHLTVWNRSTVEARFDLIPSGEWTVEPSSVVLAADEKRDLAIGGSGSDGATVAVIVRGTAPIPQGHSESIIQLEARIFHARPFDPLRLVLPAFWLVVVVVTAVAVVRRLRPWEYRLSRAGR